jgi:hypothetical protein
MNTGTAPHGVITQPVEHGHSRTLAQFCACVLALLLPGSFIVLPLIWLYRLFTSPAERS